jgi:hypothetical protein
VSFPAARFFFMDLSPGYNLPATLLNRLTVLDWIYDNGGKVPGTSVEVGDLFQDRHPEERLALTADLRDFESRGWVSLDERASGVATVTVQPSGVDFIESIQRHRGDTVGRRRAARDAVLRWLFDCNVEGQSSPVISAFSESAYGFYYGHAFTETERKDATGWLKENGYLKGTGAWGGVIPRPSITANGESLVESGRSVNDASPASTAADAPPSVMVTVKDSTNVNIAALSPGATQSATITEDQRSLILNVADALEQALTVLGLDSVRVTDARSIVHDLRQIGGESAPEAGRLRQLLDKAATVAVAGTGTAVGSGVVSLVKRALEELGLN